MPAASGVPAIHAEAAMDQGERLPSATSSPATGREPYCMTQHVEPSTLGWRKKVEKYLRILAQEALVLFENSSY